MVRKRFASGVLVHRTAYGRLEVFLVHPGGPYWAKKDRGAWSIPKGEPEEGEDSLACARREFREETGRDVDGPFVLLGSFAQPGGKVVEAWSVEADFDANTIQSNTFEMEWPPRSGRLVRFPEVDRAAWFDLVEAKGRILRGQAPFIDELVRRIDEGN